MQADPGSFSRPPECPAVNESSLPSCRDHDEIHRLQLAWHGLVLSVGFPLNAVAIWVFVRLLRLRTVVTVYLANLAVCDLLFTLTLPLRIFYFATDLWPLGNVLCQVAGSLFQLNMYGSCLFLAAVNVDRYLALVHPLRSRPFRRRQVAWRVCGVVWALILLGSIPMALAHDTSSCEGINASVEVRCFESFSNRDWKTELLPLVVLAEVLGFLLPLSTVLYCSVRILRVLGHGGSRAAEGEADRRRKKVRLLLLANAGIFILCFLPYNLLLASYAGLRVENSQSDESVRVQLRFALQIAMLLSSSNCCLDPLVYYFSTEGFRATFRARVIPPDGSVGASRGRWTLLLTSRKKKRRGTRASDPGSPPAEGELVERREREGNGEVWERKGEECL
ncbi:lysophosphatidic acid receptor 5-like [Pristis pectinata]|uniref:lysophosphatidic acid receptor 5-like n=1 Tax=Pristis pectinata TaxID=685728 RepID=UPI00223D7694|nr:lysophosphatidic acid receptor 5-like [Pristis pectinata]XP_051865289.1 lysophosphatidic acid receptor 5-like [Pristis pectinata]XP_051865290.1 lysophosphatidic acid receptor 5-like [Pristis pectinata]